MLRDYDAFVERLNAIRWPYMTTDTVGVIRGYPVYCVQLTRLGENRPCIFLAAGTHGDEPAGPEAVLSFLERDNTRLVETFDMFVLPCINPYGYVRDMRENADGVDINRSFEDDNAPEVPIVKSLLQGRRFTYFIEFHEDWESPGFYLYELRRNGPSLASFLIAQIAKVGPINESDVIEDMRATGGAISANPDEEGLDIGLRALPLYVYAYHADHTLTLETPTSWPLEQRVAAHLAGLDVTLAHYLQQVS